MFPGVTHQWLYRAEVFNLVAAEVEVCEAGALVGQNFQPSWDPVIAEFKLWISGNVQSTSSSHRLVLLLKKKENTPTFLSLFSFGKWPTVVSPTLIVLRNSSSSNSSVRPSIFPLFERQLSNTSSLTWRTKQTSHQHLSFWEKVKSLFMCLSIFCFKDKTLFVWFTMKLYFEEF